MSSSKRSGLHVSVPKNPEKKLTFWEQFKKNLFPQTLSSPASSHLSPTTPKSPINYFVVEPAEKKNQSPGSPFPQDKLTSATYIGPNQRAVIAHVDSCAAIIMKLSGGGAIVGHVGMADVGLLDDQGGSIEKSKEFIDKMKQTASNDKKITEVAFFGDGNWDKTIAGMRNNTIFAGATTTRTNNIPDGGIDIDVQVGSDGSVTTVVTSSKQRGF